MQRRQRSRLKVVCAFLVPCLFAAHVRAQDAAVATPAQPAANPVFTAQQIKFFESEVRPILATHCWKCHGAEKQQGGLRLDSRAAVLAGGDLGPAAAAGNQSDSRLIEYVGYASDTKMPPAGKLSQRELAALGRWVQEGLPWPASDEPAPPSGASKDKAAARPIPWSFQPVSDPPVPEVKDTTWCRSEIDRFVLARLEAAGLRPAPPAEKRTLLRRAKFDLLGLPPTPQETDEFLADDAPDAFARRIERYLAMPEYGQRWGRHWLDVARYADSNGQDENLAYVNAFRYRDYVIDALNADKPFDQFIREQIAGDLLPAADDRQRFERMVATGFLTLGPKMLAEDDPVKMEMDIIDEQVDTVGGAFLGMTLGCARCHDHKFDPVSTADYYAVAGIFKSTQTMDNFKVVAKWHERPLATAAELATRAAHDDRLAKKKAELTQLTADANRALAAAARERLAEYLVAATDVLAAPALVSLLQSPHGKIATGLPPETIVREAEEFDRGNVLVDTSGYGAGIGIILNRGELPNFAEYDLNIPSDGHYQLELRYAAAQARSVAVLFGGEVRKSGAAGEETGSWNPDTQAWHVEGVYHLPAGRVTLRLERRDGPIPHFDAIALVPRLAPASGTAVGDPAELARLRNLNPAFLAQWVSYLKKARDDAASPWQFWFASLGSETVLREGLSPVAAAVAARLNLGEVQIASDELARRFAAEITAAEARIAAAKAATDQKPDEAQLDPLDEVLAKIAGPSGPLRVPEKAETHYPSEVREQYVRLEREVKEIEAEAPPAPPEAMAVEEGKPSDLRIHIRGSHLTQGELSPRGFPRTLAGVSPSMPGDASGRAQLAEWIAAPSNPLTSRVAVNRVWRWHFGAGLVRSTDNFGNLGERPSHPELLDWLASRFVADGWSIKSLHRRIMLSATYQMSAAYQPAAAEADPDNRLLWRMNRRRLEAEAVRDSLLAEGGQLDTSLGGSLLNAKAREYVAGTASVNKTNYATNRRSVYLPVVRSALYEPLQAFDFAEPTTLKGDRDSTTIASQALFMMNSDIMAEQSKRLADRLASEHTGDRAARVNVLYRTALTRQPTEAETARALDFIDRYSALGDQNPEEREQAAWQALCRVVLSSNEFMYVD